MTDRPPSPAAPIRPLVGVLTLGCKLNQAESQAWGRTLRAAGCEVVDRPVAADGYLLNTCSVTHVADRKARRLIRAAKRLAPSAPVVVTGCYAEWAGPSLARETGADVVLPNRDKARAPAALLAALLTAPQTQPAAVAAAGRGDGPGVAALGRTRAFIKIQEGCDDVCAFCIVPAVRGRERARPIAEIVREAQAAESRGTLEVVLTGTQPGAYGRDRDDHAATPDGAAGTNAASLLAALLSATTLPRIRYSSIQPQDVTPALLAQWEDARLCRHFHLALQSGADAVLRGMRRRYTAGGYLRALEQIRAAAPGVAITADVIVGFPGESAHDFAATLAVCREAAFADVHVFPYSPRPRTSGAKAARRRRAAGQARAAAGRGGGRGGESRVVPRGAGGQRRGGADRVAARRRLAGPDRHLRAGRGRGPGGRARPREPAAGAAPRRGAGRRGWSRRGAAARVIGLALVAAEDDRHGNRTRLRRVRRRLPGVAGARPASIHSPQRDAPGLPAA